MIFKKEVSVSVKNVLSIHKKPHPCLLTNLHGQFYFELFLDAQCRHKTAGMVQNMETSVILHRFYIYCTAAF